MAYGIFQKKEGDFLSVKREKTAFSSRPFVLLFADVLAGQEIIARLSEIDSEDTDADPACLCD